MKYFSAIEGTVERQEVLNNYNIHWAWDMDFYFVFDNKEDYKRAIEILKKECLL